MAYSSRKCISLENQNKHSTLIGQILYSDVMWKLVM